MQRHSADILHFCRDDFFQSIHAGKQEEIKSEA